MIIWNFLQSFSPNLRDLKLTQKELYVALKYDGDEPLEIVSRLHLELLNFYLDDLFEKNKIDTVKEFIDAPFY